MDSLLEELSISLREQGSMFREAPRRRRSSNNKNRDHEDQLLQDENATKNLWDLTTPMRSLLKLIDGDSPSTFGFNATYIYINMDNTRYGGCPSSLVVRVDIQKWERKH
jgi:hypothetical protein